MRFARCCSRSHRFCGRCKPVAWATKGFELDTGKLPHQVAEDVLGPGVPLAVLSGPTFAKEVGDGLPTLITVAATSEEFANDLARSLSTHAFRAYTTADMTGVEVGAAVKNVLAIGAGISDGLGFGANTRVALINARAGRDDAPGSGAGRGAGDLHGSGRHGRPGADLHRQPVAQPAHGPGAGRRQKHRRGAAEIGQVVEGVHAARAVQVAQRLGVDMPICEQIYRMLYEDGSPSSPQWKR